MNTHLGETDDDVQGSFPSYILQREKQPLLTDGYSYMDAQGCSGWTTLVVTLPFGNGCLRRLPNRYDGQDLDVFRPIRLPGKLERITNRFQSRSEPRKRVIWKFVVVLFIVGYVAKDYAPILWIVGICKQTFYVPR